MLLLLHESKMLSRAPEARMNLLAFFTFYGIFRDGNIYSRDEIVKLMDHFKKSDMESPNSDGKDVYPMGIDNPKALVYDAMNIGQPFACPVFLSHGRGEYKYVGPGYKATNRIEVINTTKGEGAKKVGFWMNGLFYVKDSERLEDQQAKHKLSDLNLINELKDGITWWRLFELKTSDIRCIIETAS